MTKNFSAYLDATRFLAALTVMCAHFTFPQFTGGIVPYQGTLAGDAVALFFVLSGYVIAYVSATKERMFSDFAVSRFARIYSVALPALALTITLDLVGRWLGSPLPLPMYQYHQLWKYLALFLTFTTEIGPFRESVLTNGVFWSLSYEVWYYITFAIAFYLAGWKRAILLPLVLIALGPRVLLYLPIWLSGIAVFYLHQHTKMESRTATIIFAATLLLIVIGRTLGIDQKIDQDANLLLHGWPVAHLRNSQNFASHYVLAFLICANFYAAKYCRLRIFDNTGFRSLVVYCASFTFALYLAHRPLMNFLAFVLHHNPHSPLSVVTLFVAVLLCSWGFGLVTEHRKNAWRRFFRYVFRRNTVSPEPK